MGIDSKIRFATIFDMSGTVLFSAHREGVQNLLSSEESQKSFKSIFPVFKLHGELSNLELEFVRKDGSTFFGSINAAAIYGSEGNFIMSRSTLFDVTYRKQAEEALNKAKKEARRLSLDLQTRREAPFILSLWGSRDGAAPKGIFECRLVMNFQGNNRVRANCFEQGRNVTDCHGIIVLRTPVLARVAKIRDDCGDLLSPGVLQRTDEE